MDKDELWRQTTELLLEGIGPNDAEGVFLGLLEPLGVFGDTLVLSTENLQVEEWVKANFAPKIEAALTRVAGRDMTVAVGPTAGPQAAALAAAPQAAPQDAPAAAPYADSSYSDSSYTDSSYAESSYAENSYTPSYQETPYASPRRTEPEPAADPEWLSARVSPSDISHAPVPSETFTPTTAPSAAPRPAAKTDPASTNQALFGKCTFDTFVVGRSNEFARGASLAVAEQPGTAYNPLFIYGSSGLGKTHLLVAIANYARQNFPQMRTLYVSANDFLNDYVTATQKNQWNAFNEKYHEVDILLIDDVQYLENKDETVNQFFNIFNAMINRNKQVVLSADRAPRDINMDERMRSRFNSGLLADIKPPDYETRLAILRNYLSRVRETTNFTGIIPEDVLSYLAEASTSNIREIEGAITRLISNMSLLKRDSITVDEARELLVDFFPDDRDRPIEISEIMTAVERYFGVSHEDMISTKRNREITTPRHIAIYLSRFLTEESLENIGRMFGGRDHTTVMHSVSKIERGQKEDRVLFDQVEQLTRQLNERR